LLLCGYLAGAARAADAAPPAGDDAGKPVVLGSPVEVSYSLTATSDYRYAGISQTDNRPALQGSLDANWRSFYVGAWASQVDFGKTDDGRPIARAEVDLYGGVTRTMAGIELDLGLTEYLYPAAHDADGEFDYLELKLGASREIVEDTTLALTARFAPQYFAGTGTNWLYEAKLTRSLPKIGDIAPELAGSLGYQDGQERNEGIDYGFWNAGLSLALADHYKLDLRYHDTFAMPVACDQTCDGRLVVSLTGEF
jgi:uncharacterized protein (TIGR02001 family)